MEFDQLITQLLEVAGRVWKGKDDALAKQLRMFETVVQRLKDRQLVKNHFEQIYKQNRQAILLGPFCDYWLRENGVHVNLTEGVEVKKQIKLSLSALYRSALTMRDKEQETVTLLIDWDKLRAPLQIMSVLYQMFAVLDPEEKVLTIYSDQLTVVMSTEPVHRDGIGSFIGSIMEKFGMKTDDTPIKDSDLQNALSMMTENPQMTNIIGMITSAHTSGKPPDMSQLVSSMKDLPMVKDLPTSIMDDIFTQVQNSAPPMPPELPTV